VRDLQDLKKWFFEGNLGFIDDVNAFAFEYEVCTAQQGDAL